VIVLALPLGLDAIGAMRVVSRWREDSFSDMVGVISMPRGAVQRADDDRVVWLARGVEAPRVLALVDQRTTGRETA